MAKLFVNHLSDFMPFVFLLCIVLCASSAIAEETILSVQTGDVIVPAPWTVKTKSGDADVTLRSVEGTRGICMKSRTASFAIQRPAEIPASRATLVRWTWRSDELPIQGDLRSSNTDDQAAQLFIAFENRNTITYVWDSNAPVGTVMTSWIPFVVRIKTVVVQSGDRDLRKWIRMERDLRRDYESLYNEAMPSIAAVRYQINSQHTHSAAASCIAEIAFTASGENR